MIQERSFDGISRRSARVVVLVLVISWLTGCVRAPRVELPGSRQDPEVSAQVCRVMTKDRSSSGALRAMVEATVQVGSHESVSFRYGIVHKEPSMMRIDVLPLEGAYTLGLFTLKDGTARFIDTQERTYAEESSADTLLEHFLGLRGLSPRVVLALLERQVPELACERVAVFVNQKNSVILDPVDHLAWTVDGVSPRLESVAILDSSNEVIEARASITSSPSGYPTIGIMVYAPTSASAHLLIKKMTPNPEVPDRIFEVPIPSGYRRID